MMRKFFRGHVILIVLGFLLASCTTVPRPIQTPAGAELVVDGELSVLRVLRQSVTTGNQPNAQGGVYIEDIVLSCPQTTQAAIPVLESNAYGFGEIDPDDLSRVDSLGSLSFIIATRRDRPFGSVFSGLVVTDLDAPDASGEQSVTVRYSAFLADASPNANDPWWHVQTFHLLCLGNRPLD